MGVRDISVCVLSVFLIFLGISRAQQDNQKPQSSSMGGIASGVPAAPIYDPQNRPITAGGFVDKGAGHLRRCREAGRTR